MTVLCTEFEFTPKALCSILWESPASNLSLQGVIAIYGEFVFGETKAGRPQFTVGHGERDIETNFLTYNVDSPGRTDAANVPSLYFSSNSLRGGRSRALPPRA